MVPVYILHAGHMHVYILSVYNNRYLTMYMVVVVYEEEIEASPELTINTYKA